MISEFSLMPGIIIQILFGLLVVGSGVGAPVGVSEKKVPRPSEDGAIDKAVGASGKENIKSHGVFVIGGEPASPATWRFVVTIEAEGVGFICAGSLITWDAVLTTAHCVNEVTVPIYVKIGVYDRTADDQLDEILVEQIHVHEEYDQSNSYLNDVAVLRLERETPFRPPLVTRADLPLIGGDYTRNENCYLAGWGRTDVNNTDMSPVLAERHVWVINHCTCQDRWDRSLFKPRVYETNVCVDDQGGTVSACQGDSGSPLACVVEGRWVVVGVSSWGSAACHTYPSVFTDTTDYVLWIMEKITDETTAVTKNKAAPEQSSEKDHVKPEVHLPTQWNDAVKKTESRRLHDPGASTKQNNQRKAMASIAA